MVVLKGLMVSRPGSIVGPWSESKSGAEMQKSAFERQQTVSQAGFVIEINGSGD